MSAQRSPWEPSETALLSQIRSEMPTAKLLQIFEAFHARNHQIRTKNAVKAKLKGIDLPDRGQDGVTTSAPSEEHCSIPSRRSFSVRYEWSAPELGIFIPLHPLIAEARRHAARALMPGHAHDFFGTTKWPSTFGGADISRLRCAEGDRVALQNYLDYLKAIELRSRGRSAR